MNSVQPARYEATSAHPSFVAAAGALFAAAVLCAGCGGGSADTSDAAAEAADLRDTSSLASPSQAAPPAIAPAYSWKYITAPDGSPARTIGGAGMPRLINTAGQLIAGYGNNPPGPYALFHDLRSGTTKSIFDPAEHYASFAAIITERADVLVSHWALNFRIRAFLWSSETGQLDEIPTGGDLLTETKFLTNDRVVGGLTDIVLGAREVPLCLSDTTQCVAFHWDAETGTMTKHPYFNPAWMNDAGTMVGLHQPPGASRARVATLARDGTITPVAATLEAQYQAVVARHIADDGQVIVSVRDGNGPGSSFAIRGNSIRSVIEGLALPQPDICTQRPCFADTQLLNFSDNGQAIGHVEMVYRNNEGNWEAAGRVAFHWSPQAGAVPITAGQAELGVVSVNRHGAVLGLVRPQPNGPFDTFVWTRDKGVVLLRTLAPTLPPPERAVEPESIGDGGHILLRDRLVSSALMVLTPLQECLEAP